MIDLCVDTFVWTPAKLGDGARAVRRNGTGNALWTSILPMGVCRLSKFPNYGHAQSVAKWAATETSPPHHQAYVDGLNKNLCGRHRLDKR